MQPDVLTRTRSVALHGSQISGDHVSQFVRVAERGQVTAGYDSGLGAEPFADRKSVV